MKSIYSPKLDDLLYKQLDRDEMNTVYATRDMQLSHLWLNNFFGKKSVEYHPFIHQN